MLMDRSPVTHASRIERPLLIAHGANDPRVKRSDTDGIVQSLQAAGVPVTFVVYDDEAHGFSRPQNRLSFYAVAEGFLAEHLGGRTEPIGNDFDGSTIRVPTGATEVVGVSEALE